MKDKTDEGRVKGSWSCQGSRVFRDLQTMDKSNKQGKDPGRERKKNKGGKQSSVSETPSVS